MTATLTAPVFTIDDIPALNAKLDGAAAHDIIRFAYETFGDRLVMACSFQDMVMLDIVSKAAPDVRVFTLDTGFLFKHTEDTIARARKHYPQLDIEVYRPDQTIFEQADSQGRRLYESDPGLCCSLRKIEPMARALDGADAWMTGIRRDQSAERSMTPAVAWDPKWNRVKFAPMHDWTSKAIWAYAEFNDVPYNPMHDWGYPSIGCAPCTSIPVDGDSRSGRWANTAKTECGLHAPTEDAVGVPGRVEQIADRPTVSKIDLVTKRAET